MMLIIILSIVTYFPFCYLQMPDHKQEKCPNIKCICGHNVSRDIDIFIIAV